MHTKTPAQITVSERALTQRVNRKLSKKHEKLCKTRGESYRWAYYVLDTSRNEISGAHPIIDSKADVEVFARKIGALQKHEELK